MILSSLEIELINRRARALYLTDVNRVDARAAYQDTLHYFESLPADYFRNVDVEPFAAGPWQLYTIKGFRTLWHNNQVPSPRRDSSGRLRYFLFGIPVLQADWFRFLQLTPEDQLVHCLKWGSLDDF